MNDITISLPDNVWEIVKNISEYTDTTPHDYLVKVITFHVVNFDIDMGNFYDEWSANYDD